MPHPRPDSFSNAPVPTTRWSRVLAAGNHADPAARGALAERCAAYWYPLYTFVRRKGYPPATPGTRLWKPESCSQALPKCVNVRRPHP